MFNVIQTQRASESMFWKSLFGLVIVEYIFATYLWLSSCLRSSFHSFFSPPPSVYARFFKAMFLQNAWQIMSGLTLKTVSHEFHILLQMPLQAWRYIHFSSLFVIRLQSFLSKDLWEKHILRTSGPRILQLSVMPLEAHRGCLFFILNV